MHNDYKDNDYVDDDINNVDYEDSDDDDDDNDVYDERIPGYKAKLELLIDRLRNFKNTSYENEPEIILRKNITVSDLSQGRLSRYVLQSGWKELVKEDIILVMSFCIDRQLHFAIFKD